MKKIYKTFRAGLIVSALFAFTAENIYAQKTFTTVYNILQANCASSGCHGGTDYEAFSLDGSETDVYEALVNMPPVNEKASAKGNKLVDPNHPYNSFLLKKIGSAFDSYLSLDDDEGDLMTDSQKHPLADYEIELVRQWIMQGAPKNGNVVDYQLIQDYYILGGSDFMPVPDAPDPSEGIQLRYGPIFVAAGGEIELMKKEKVNNEDPIEVYRLDGYMTTESHHMLLFKANTYSNGMRVVPFEDAPFNSGSLASAWQDAGEFELPEGSAFFWDANTILDFDYHIANTGNNQILPADFYLNIYYRPRTPSSETIEMKAQLVNQTVLLLPSGIQNRVHTHDFNGDRYIHLITSHTHKYGVGYDIFANNGNNNTKGEKIYDGFYNTNYTFYQGWYDWEHPPIRRFDPLIKISDGLIYDATWDVNGPCNSVIPGVCVNFGFTTDDEMMLFTYFYTSEELKSSEPTSIEAILTEPESNFEVYPNPFHDVAMINYSLGKASNVTLEVFDVLGRRTTTLAEEFQTAGHYNYSIEHSDNPAGVYFIRLTANGKTYTQKLVGTN